MRDLLYTDLSWWQFFLQVAFVVAVYLALYFFEKIFNRNAFSGIISSKSIRFVRRLRLFYEAIAILYLIAVFVFVNPGVHTLLALLTVLFSFTTFRNYLTGRYLLLDSTLSAGNIIQFRQHEGKIYVLDRLGLRLQTDAGIIFINYHALLSEGYTLIAGEEVRKVYEVWVVDQNKEDQANLANRLNDMLITTPYINWDFPPEVFVRQNGEARLKVLLEDKKHFAELTALLRDKGYQIKM